MKRILSIIIIILLIFLLIGCTNSSKNIKTYPKPVIVMPNEETAYNINGYKNSSTNLPSSNVSEPKIDNNLQSEIEFVGNKNSKKFHKSNCRYAKNMNEENKITFSTSDEALSAGYSWCSVCSS